MAALSITPGDWDVGGDIAAAPSAGAVYQVLAGVSATINASPLIVAQISQPGGTFGGINLTMPTIRVLITTATIYYPTVNVGFSSGTCTVTGTIWARRVR
jgi:hypothetical protein